MKTSKKILIIFGSLLGLTLLIVVINWYLLHKSISSTKTRKLNIEKVK
jgi:hypothetical protein